MKETIKGPGIKLLLDSSQIFRHDPGQGTPALVILPNGDCSTFWWALGEGEVDGISLTETQFQWLQHQDNYVDDWIKKHSK